MSMFREGLSVNVEYTDLVKNQLKSKSSSSSSMVSEGVPNTDDVYASYYVDNNNVINPYKIVEEEELKIQKVLLNAYLKQQPKMILVK